MTRWDLDFTPGPEGLRNETDVPRTLLVFGFCRPRVHPYTLDQVLSWEKTRSVLVFSLIWARVMPPAVPNKKKMLDEKRPCTVQIGGGVLLSLLSRPRPAPLFCL
jgi:hypothetical protein